jgi:tetratricopeptide (TPR) repeat protein
MRLSCIYAYVWNALAGAVMDSMQHRSFEEAEKCYREAIRYQPEVPEFYVNLAMLVRGPGKLEEALKLFQKAIELRPGYETAIGGISQVLELMGDFDGAYETIRPLLKCGTEESAVALAYAAVARHFNQRQEAAALLEKAMLLPKLDHELRTMHFALAKLYDSMKEYDQSFQHSVAAHRFQRAVYDPEQNKRKFDELIAVFNAENLAHFPRSTNHSRLPVFIVGMPRSGTSLVEQILASHPQVYGAGELEDVHGMAVTLATMLGGKTAYPQCLTDAKRRHLDELAQRYLAKLSKFSRTAIRVTDKMPHNFMVLGLIELLFPGAHIIHCKRDPVDTCLSIYGLEFNANHPYADNLEHLGAYYLEYRRLMEHWKSVLSVPILEVKYEELVADQEGISRQMVEFCDLPWDERCLNFHQAERVVTTHSYDQVRRPIYKQSVARWKNYESHLTPLIEALSQGSSWINREA